MSAYIINCPACGTGNRISADKEGRRGRCGSCHATLPPLYYRPLQVDSTGFDALVAAYSGPVLAEFWAPW